MKKRVYIYLIVIVSAMFAIYGCNNKDNNELNKDEMIDNSDENDNNNVDNETQSNVYQVETLASLIDKTDEEVIAVLGEGSSQSYSREYSHIFEGQNVTTRITYNDSNKVNDIYIYLPDNDLNKWENVLTTKLGYPTKLLSIANTQSDMQTVTWKLDSTIITLFGLKNSLSVQIE